MRLSRRGLLAGAASAAAFPAHAQTREELLKFEAYLAWGKPRKEARAPMNAMLETGNGEISLGDWMDGRPAIIALWATWCTPCLIEKSGEAQMAERLIKANARARILLIQAFDEKPLPEARALLKRLNAHGVDNTRATPEAEKMFVKHFGEARRGAARPFMPSLMIAAADGRELGRHAGVMISNDRRKDYWYDDTTFDFLSSL